jgi:adenylate kinase family enzyme
MRDLLLITGIPGTGKTCYADKFAKEFGFLHHDFEDQQTLNRFVANPAEFIRELFNEKKNVVVTWGFNPDDEPSLSIVQLLRSVGFNWIWFDGNRPVALREFQKRATVQEIDLYVQMYRIEKSRVVERLKPTVINSFDYDGQFKPAEELLAEIRATYIGGPAHANLERHPLSG